MTRRSFVGAAVGTAIAQAQPEPIPIIDTHIHLFDQTRPQGVPYSGGGENKDPSLPPRYRKLATPLHIVGAIAVEASPWIEDNLWLLETMEKDPIMVGAVGNLQPEKPEFREYLDRYHRNKLFRGIRYANLWGYDIAGQVSNPTFIEGLKAMAQADLSLDVTPQHGVLEAVIRITDRVPELRVIIDHLPGVLLRSSDQKARASLQADIRELSKRDQVYVKISEVMQLNGVKPELNPDFYKPTLDYLFDAFGENRVIFGSDWPNAAAVNNLPAILKIAQGYFNTKTREQAEKFFWKNSVAAYKWVRRDPSQPQTRA